MARSVFKNGKRPRLSLFDLSHEHKLTMRMGELVPVLCTEVVPGDTFTVDSDMFMRLMPLAAPMMHRVDVFVHYFFVPTRLVWDNFDKFLTGGPDGTAVVEHPRMDEALITSLSSGFYHTGSLYDYFGLPVADSDFVGKKYPAFSTLPFRAYNLIYNDWYRDETLCDEATVLKSDGSTGESLGLYQIKKRAWKKGYFEAALPWTQRGPGAQVPLEGNLPVTAPSDGVILPFADTLTNHGNGRITPSEGAVTGTFPSRGTCAPGPRCVQGRAASK